MRTCERLVVAASMSAVGLTWSISVGARVLGTGTAFQSKDNRSVWSGVYTEEQAKRGEAVYGSQCSSCHGDEMTGTPSAPPLAGDGFLKNWDGKSVNDLVEKISSTMPADSPGALSPQQTVDVIAFMFDINKFPAGGTALDATPTAARLIKIEAKASQDR